VQAEGAATMGDLADHAHAVLAFEDGMVGDFEAWRAAPARERTMRVVFPSGEVRIDFLARTFEDTTAFGLNAGFAATPEGRDPLGASVSDFVAAVRGERPRPLVTGEEAARALEAALEVDRLAHA
jgi:predicted dehydrogenase